MKLFLIILFSIMFLWILFLGVCLIKYIRFDKRMKEINQKQNEKDINSVNLN